MRDSIGELATATQQIDGALVERNEGELCDVAAAERIPADI
ncbi:hypothetical protein [Ensifer aridi]|nr:hypothetical protein [Ensifer aridi]